MYVVHRLRNIIRELSHIAGDVRPVGRGRVATHNLTRAMTEIECAVRHIEATEHANSDSNHLEILP